MDRELLLKTLYLLGAVEQQAWSRQISKLRLLPCKPLPLRGRLIGKNRQFAKRLNQLAAHDSP